MWERRIQDLRRALFNLAEAGSGSKFQTLTGQWAVFEALCPPLTLSNEARTRLESLKNKRNAALHQLDQTIQCSHVYTVWHLARIAVHYRIRELMSGEGQAEGLPQGGNLEMLNKGVEAILVNAGVAGLDCLKEGRSAAS
jgi:hypothetical protein